MKYKAHKIATGKHAGQFAVFKNSRAYFVNSVCESQIEADAIACSMSASWHQQQIDKCQDEWEKIQKSMGNENPNWGDQIA